MLLFMPLPCWVSLPLLTYPVCDVWYLVCFQETEMETEEEVDILMSSDVYSATLSTKSITFSRAQTGWLFREDKTVSVASPTLSPITTTCAK